MNTPTVVTMLTFLLLPVFPLPADTNPKWDLEYAATMEPDRENAVDKRDGSKVSFQKPAKENYDLVVQQDGLDFFFRGAGVFVLEPEGEAISFDHNTLGFRLRLDKTDNRIEPPTKNTSAVCLQVGESRADDPGMYVVGFYTDFEDGANYVVLEGRETTIPHAIGSEFHDYRVVARGNSIALFVDGESVGEVAPRRGVNLPGIRFGNARGSDHTGQATLGHLRMSFGEALDP